MEGRGYSTASSPASDPGVTRRNAQVLLPRDIVNGYAHLPSSTGESNHEVCTVPCENAMREDEAVMTRKRPARVDLIEQEIEVVLNPGAFIPDRACFSCVSDLDEVAAKIAKLTANDPSRAAILYETKANTTTNLRYVRPSRPRRCSPAPRTDSCCQARRSSLRRCSGYRRRACFSRDWLIDTPDVLFLRPEACGPFTAHATRFRRSRTPAPCGVRCRSLGARRVSPSSRVGDTIAGRERTGSGRRSSGCSPSDARESSAWF